MDLLKNKEKQDIIFPKEKRQKLWDKPGNGSFNFDALQYPCQITGGEAGGVLKILYIASIRLARKNVCVALPHRLGKEYNYEQ